MHMGVGQIKGYVVQKPEPSQSEDKKRTFYTLVIAGIGFQQRFDCSPEVYNAVAVDDEHRTFEGPLAAHRAKRSGSDYDGDFQKLSLQKIVKAPAAAGK